MNASQNEGSSESTSIVLAVVLPLLLLLLLALLVRSLRRRGGTDLKDTGGTAAVDTPLYTNPAYGDGEGLGDGDSPSYGYAVGIYTAIDDTLPDSGVEETPGDAMQAGIRRRSLGRKDMPRSGNGGYLDVAGADIGADGQSLYAAVDYGDCGNIGDLAQQQEMYESIEDEAAYQIPFDDEPRPPTLRRADQRKMHKSPNAVDGGGENYENVRNNPYQTKPGGFESEDYADLLGEQKMYGKACHTKDGLLVPMAGTKEMYLVPMMSDAGTHYEDLHYGNLATLAPPAPLQPPVRRQGNAPPPGGYSALWDGPECEYAAADDADDAASSTANVDAIYGNESAATRKPPPGTKERSAGSGDLYDGFDSAEPAPGEEDSVPWMRLGMSRTDADTFLLDQSEGAFVVRASSKANSFAISVAVNATRKKKNAAFHQIIQVKGMASASPTYRIKRATAGPFASIAALVEHYAAHLVADDIPVLLSADHSAWGGDAGGAVTDNDVLYGNPTFGDSGPDCTA